jgi:hypothetical protein
VLKCAHIFFSNKSIANIDLGALRCVFWYIFIFSTHQIASNCSSAVGEENNLFLPSHFSTAAFPVSEKGAKNFNEIPIRTQFAINVLRL